MCCQSLVEISFCGVWFVAMTDRNQMAVRLNVGAGRSRGVGSGGGSEL